MRLSSFLRRNLIWNSGFTRLMDLLRRTLFKPVFDSCVRTPDLFRITSMKVLYNFCMRPEEIMKIADTIKEKAPCRMLVFGLGNDSGFWTRINSGGRTVFLEDNRAWMERITSMDDSIEAYPVKYGTRLRQWKELLKSPDDLDMDLPEEVVSVEWDIVLVDAPKGCRENSPGRMKSIYTAADIGISGTDVFVHDCNREIERVYCDEFLGERNLYLQVSRLRHYRLDLEDYMSIPAEVCCADSRESN